MSIYGCASDKNHPLYSTYIAWKTMRARCRSKNKNIAKHYLNRGITFCVRWESFAYFLEDMGQKPPGMTLDRIDNEKGYSKENCRWISKSHQPKNTRKNVYYTYEGKTLTEREWAKEIGVSSQKIKWARRKGIEWVAKNRDKLNETSYFLEETSCTKIAKLHGLSYGKVRWWKRKKGIQWVIENIELLKS
jgi:hypothetical protein